MGGAVIDTDELAEAVAGSDVFETDTCVSMWREEEETQRVETLRPYAINASIMDAAASAAIVLHDLPAYRGYEIDADVLEGPRSVVWDDAENRLHAQKALLAWLLGDAGRSRQEIQPRRTPASSSCSTCSSATRPHRR